MGYNQLLGKVIDRYVLEVGTQIDRCLPLDFTKCHILLIVNLLKDPVKYKVPSFWIQFDFTALFLSLTFIYIIFFYQFQYYNWFYFQLFIPHYYHIHYNYLSSFSYLPLFSIPSVLYCICLDFTLFCSVLFVQCIFILIVH